MVESSSLHIIMSYTVLEAVTQGRQEGQKVRGPCSNGARNKVTRSIYNAEKLLFQPLIRNQRL